jgi:two-component system, NtrC family, nitrogen regulation response regulator GlnG
MPTAVPSPVRAHPVSTPFAPQASPKFAGRAGEPTAPGALPPVIIVDDEPAIRLVLSRAVEAQGLTPRAFASLTEARHYFADHEAVGRADLQERALLVFLDLRLPDGDGLKFLEEVIPRIGRTPVIVITASDPEDTAVAAIRLGAQDFLPKPFSLEQIDGLLAGALARFRESTGRGEAAAETGEYPAVIEAVPQSAGPGGLIGRSPAMIEVFKSIGRLARSDVNVLITGESGTGKERTAYAIHAESSRREGPFITVNTAAIPYDLLENELFGHLAGAYTGASSRFRGRFEQAQGGTLFLDEIGEMPLGLQVKLLRAVQEKVIVPLGGDKPIAIDCRIVAATNIDLRDAIRDRTFREDLFYRLSVGEIHLPPLRDRGEDILRIADGILARLATDRARLAPLRGGAPGRYTLTPDARRLLLESVWPGNVRELENALRRATLSSIGGVIHALDIAGGLPSVASGSASQAGFAGPATVASANAPTGAPVTPGAPTTATPVPPAGGFETAAIAGAASGVVSGAPTEPDGALRTLTLRAFTRAAPGQIYDEALGELTQSLIQEALARTGQNQLKAAALLGLNRNTLREKLRAKARSAAADALRAGDPFAAGVPPLYVLVDAPRRSPADPLRGPGARPDPVTLTRVALAAGARWIQLRAKGWPLDQVRAWAATVRDLCAETGALFVLNDHVGLAAELGVGVHLGQGDMRVADARRALGPQAVIGLSTHSPQQMQAALGEPVTYVAIGPVYATASKADAEPAVGLAGVAAVRAILDQHVASGGPPLVAIGGLNAANVGAVYAAGAQSVAVLGAVCDAADPAQAVRALLAQAPKRTGAGKPAQRLNPRSGAGEAEA